MKKRLQVLLDEREMQEIEQRAYRDQMTVSAWVRRVLRTVLQDQPLGDRQTKLAAIRAAAQYAFPLAPDEH